MVDYNSQISEIKNILDNIEVPGPFNKSEHAELVETSGILIDDLISDNPQLYEKSSFALDLIEIVSDLLEIQLEDIFSYDIRNYIETAVSEAIKIYHTYICPVRSYSNTFIRKEPQIQNITKKITYLRNIPQPEQGTTEWYIFRHNFLTASSIWKVFGSERLRDQLIYDKCSKIDLKKYNYVNIESPLHWGHKYEPLSLMWYEQKYKTNVSDYGCIPHKSLNYLAASPDGINTDINSSRYGRMIEVKNIVNREITGIPKMEYWIQMQIQMEVCILNECDFLETRFVEYDNKEEFEGDGEFHKTSDGKLKGVIMHFLKDGQPLYEYAPIGLTEKEFEFWEISIMEKRKKLTWVHNIYWKLDEVNCVLVLRNSFWFKYVQQKLEETWSIIQKEKVSGFEHRAPKRKEKNKSKPLPTTKQRKCFINIENLLNNSSDSKPMMKPKSFDNLIKISTEVFKDTNIL